MELSLTKDKTAAIIGVNVTSAIIAERATLDGLLGLYDQLTREHVRGFTYSLDLFLPEITNHADIKVFPRICLE